MLQVSGVIEDRIDGDVAKAMLGQSPQCIKLLDSAGHLQFMSENGQHLMEIDDFGALRGRKWWDLWPEESRDILRKAVASARRGISVSFDAPCPTAGGTSKHWRVRVSPVHGGDLDGMILAASEDISAEIAAAEARRALELDNHALRKFSRFVAHDLRGPIRHHKLLAEMIGRCAEDDPADAEVPVLAEKINVSASALLNLLAGLEKLHAVEETDSAAVADCDIEDICRNAAMMTGAPGLTLETDCAGAVVRADPGQLLAVFANLFDNAVKYASTAGRVTVRVHAARQEDGAMAITLADDGPGFAADRIDNVFQPLVRQSNSIDTPGAGLGLSIVERVLSRHGGSVRIIPRDDAATGGATLRLTLPCDPVPPSDRG